MAYWIALKNQKYISNINTQGKITHTQDIAKAYKIKTIDEAMIYFNKGYCIIKEY